MIVPMTKVFVVARRGDRDQFLRELRDRGVIHLTPLDPTKAALDEKTAGGIRDVERVLQILGAHEPDGPAPTLQPAEAVQEVLDIQRRTAERQSRLASLERLLKNLAIWGDVRVEQLEALQQAGLQVRFFAVPEDLVDEVRAECVHPLGPLAGQKVLVAAIDRRREVHVPKKAQPLPTPTRDAPSIRAEAAEIEAAMMHDAAHLRQLAHLQPAIEAHLAELRQQADYVRALRGSLSDEHLFALQGWMPADAAPALQADLSQGELVAAVRIVPPDPDENPPTLIRYPCWARPIRAMFDILGTVPGYREFDLSGFFMLALPLFGAMLLGDAGYGLVFLLIGLLCRRRIIAAVSGEAANLILVFGTATLVWGLLTCNFFGITPKELAFAGGFGDVAEMRAGGGFWALLGRIMLGIGVLWNPDDEIARNMIIQASFLIGGTHLVLAHLRQALGLAPSLRFLAEVGWCSFLAGMLGVVWMLFFPDQVWMPTPVMIGLLIAGAVLVILFSHPSRNPAKRIGLGLVANILPMISTFSDTVSYIRLMAVGLASYYIASAFNGLAYQVGAPSPWLLPAAVLIVVLAHALNIVLGIIAIFAHGVRLNMLEFSSNAGVQWAGYPFAPFAPRVRTG
jgi:V/A-type H+-transporting ATPase subunit I